MVRVGNIEYDHQRLNLSIGGVDYKLEPKVGALLAYFLAHPNRIVTKEELLESVWQGVIVSENALERLISHLRAKLKSETDYLQIKTVRKRGYCLEVKEKVLSRTKSKPRWLRWAVVVVFILCVASAEFWWLSEKAPAEPVFSIAVLPFADMSEQANYQYLSDGLTEELLHMLAGIDGTQVASRTSSMVYKNNQTNITEIAQELNVNYILEGSIRKSDDNIKVTVQLIDAAKDVHIWSHTYNRKMTDILVLQQDIAYSVLNSLRHMFHLQPYNTASLPTPQALPEIAYENYQKARQLSYKSSRLNLKKAIAMAELATQHAEQFEPAWELLASLYLTAIPWEWDDRNYRQLASQTLQQIEELDANSPFLQLAKGTMERYSFNWARALKHYNQAILMDPSNASFYKERGYFWHQTGFIQKASEDFERCLQLLPSHVVCMKHSALAKYLLGNPNEALEQFFRAEELGANRLKSRFSTVLIDNGHRYAVLLHLKVLFYIFERIEDFPYSDMLDLYANIAISDTARQQLLTLVLSKEINVTESMLLALKAYEHIKPNLTAEGMWYPEFPEFYQSSRFQSLLLEMNLPTFWREFGFPRQCKPKKDTTVICQFSGK